MIYNARHTQAVSFKSPLLILIGCFALYTDSIVNTILLVYSFGTFTEKNVDSMCKSSCYLSVIDTIVVHYIAYFCMIFRAIRIFNILKIEAKFLDNIYDLQMFISANGQLNESSENIPLINKAVPSRGNESEQNQMNYDQFKDVQQNMLVKQNQNMNEQIKQCNEWLYVIKIGALIIVMSIICVVSLLVPNPLLSFIPIFHSAECLYLSSLSNGSLKNYIGLWQLVAN